MRILAKYKNSTVVLIATRPNGICDIIVSELDTSTNYVGKIKTVKADELTVIDNEYVLIPTLVETIEDSKEKEKEKYKEYANKSIDDLKKELTPQTNKATFIIKEAEI